MKRKKKKGIWLKKIKGCWKRFIHKIFYVYGYDIKITIIFGTILIICIILMVVL